MAVVLSLLAALLYGTADFAAGMITSRIQPWITAFVVVLSGGVAALLGWGVTGGGSLAGHDFAWIAVAGLGLGLGSVVLYRGLASGRMGVVAPVSGVGAAVVPVLTGVLMGERPEPLVWLGILLAAPAIWLVARSPAQASPGDTGVVDGIFAGLGFGVMFAGLGQMPDHAGLLPVALVNLSAAAVVGLVALILHKPVVSRQRAALLPIVCGLVGASAMGLFMVATRYGYLSVTGVITALYPATTVLLATVVLREKVHGGQLLGLCLCAGAVALVVTA